LLADSDPMVRRNAALSLANFRDAAARSELLAMLSPQTVTAGRAGTIANRRSEGDSIERGAMLARLTVAGGTEPFEVRSAVPGIVRKQFFEDGDAVAAGDAVALLGPDPAHVFEALRALYLVGTPEDLEAVRPFLRAGEDFPPEVAQQARLTSERIRQGSVP
jgi:HEAT repeat protein